MWSAHSRTYDIPPNFELVNQYEKYRGKEIIEPDCLIVNPFYQIHFILLAMSVKIILI